jgi:predicted ester cyclase
MTDAELRSFYEGYVALANDRDFDRLDEFVHDEVIVNGTPVARDDMVAQLRGHTLAVPDFSWDLQDLVVGDGRIAARLVDRGTPVSEWNGLAPTGASVEFAETAFYEVVDGRFATMWFLMDVDTVKQQLAA